MMSRTVIVHHPIPDNLRLLLTGAGLVETQAYDGYSVFADNIPGGGAASIPSSEQPRDSQEAKLLLTPEEAADRLSLGRTKLYELMSSGALRSVRIGKSRRIPTTALADLVDRLHAG